MRRRVTRVTRAVVGVLLAGAASAQAQALLSIEDNVRKVEGSPSGVWIYNVAVTMENGPMTADAFVNWQIVPGSAKLSDSDYQTPDSGILTFPQFSTGAQYIPVRIVKDTNPEWSPTSMQDETFFIKLTYVSGPVVIKKGRGTFTLIDDDRPLPGLQFLAAVSRGDSSVGQNRLLWRVPAAQTTAPTPPDDILIRWNTGASCAPPATWNEALTGSGQGEGYLTGTFLIPVEPVGETQEWAHNNLQLNTPYCYSLFAYYAGSTSNAERMMVKAKPFDAGGRIKWSYARGCYQPWPCTTAALTAPTVALDGIFTVDMQGAVHAMLRGVGGGAWPATWNPLSVGKPTQNRSAVVPIPLTSASRLYLGTDGGGVHAVDTKEGRLIWSRSNDFGTALSTGTGGQAQPAGLFTAYGGLNDMLLVGTNNGLGNNNKFYALDPATGADLGGGPYPDTSMGNVASMAAVDYPANRVYFLSSNPSATLFALDLGGVGAPDLSLSPSLPGGNRRSFGGSSGSIILRNNNTRLIFGDSGGQVHAVNLTDGSTYTYPTNDGQVKVFLWPDRRDDRLYFATDGQVHGIRDQGGMFSPLWLVSVTGPTMVVQKPGTNYLYLGSATGELVQIDVSGPTLVPFWVEAGSGLGSPTLDGPNNLLIVGSSSGVVYAVSVLTPF